MSALDMVLQRQVPARPVAKTGEGSTGADAAGDSRNDAFSAALSNEKRSAAAQKDKVEPKDEADAEAGSVEPDDQLMSDTGQSDEVLDLLSGLMSSAAYSDDVALGKAGAGKELVPEAVIAEDADSATSEKPDAVILTNAGMAASDDANETRSTATVKTAVVKGPQVEANQVSAEVAQPAPVSGAAAGAQASGVQTVQLSDGVRSSAAMPAALVSAASAGMAGQGTQAQVQGQTKAADAGSDRQKDPSPVKEAMRALGLEGEPKPVGADAARIQDRGRNAGRQGGLGDRQIDEPAASKGGKVEVVESRRFMPAQNMSSNAQLLTRSLVEAGSNAAAAQRAAPAQPVAQPGSQQAGQTLHTLKLQLNPVSLGSVTAVLKLSGDDLSVEIKVQTAEAYRQIKEDNQAIVKALRGQGFGVEQITVQHVAGPDRASSQTPQQGFQANQQGAGSSDAQSSGRDSSRNNAGQQGSGSQGGEGHEQSSYGGPGAGRTDGVYL